MAIFKESEHPSLLVNTLAQLGAFHREQDHLDESVAWFGQALILAAEHEMQITVQVAVDLTRVMKNMGGEEFTKVWRRTFQDQEPLLEAFGDILNKLEEGGI